MGVNLLMKNMSTSFSPLPEKFLRLIDQHLNTARIGLPNTPKKYLRCMLQRLDSGGGVTIGRPLSADNFRTVSEEVWNLKEREPNSAGVKQFWAAFHNDLQNPPFYAPSQWTSKPAWLEWVHRLWEGTHSICRVMIAGSYEKRGRRGCYSEEEREEFEQRCFELGMEVARQGATLIAGTADDHTADWWALRGMHEAMKEGLVKGRREVIWFVPSRADSGRPVAVLKLKTAGGARSKSPGGKQRKIEVGGLFNLFENNFKPYKGTWKEVRPVQIPAASAIMLVGGSTGSQQIYEIATDKHNPIPFIPVPYFGGEAARLFEAERRNLETMRVPLEALEGNPPCFDAKRLAGILINQAMKHQKDRGITSV